MAMGAGGIVSILERCVAQGAERRAYIGLADGRSEGNGICPDGARLISYGELYRLAGQGARLLRERLAPGERVLLLHDDSLDFMVAFFACMFARLVAVPLPPPDATRLKRTLPRVLAVVADCQASAVLANNRVSGQLRQAFADAEGLSRLPWLTVEEFAHQSEAAPLAASADALAYLQYSSGSTASPKGAMMTHGNLLDNLRMLQRGFGYDGDATAVTWMPYFHDYGLVDGLLEPLYVQAPCYVMSPVSMIKRPWRWLQALSRLRATHTQGPNFAYQMCLDRIADEHLAGLDLSHLRSASCGAEPIRRETVEGFLARFAPHGLRPEAFAPAYGLAEGTLAVTTKPFGTPWRMAFLAPESSSGRRCIDLPPDDPRARVVVSCGVPPDPFDLCIVDPERGDELPEDTVGEIWIANPSVAAGYWNRPEETAAAFAARTSAGRGPMLRTGDLGFLRGGELYVTGRIKDLIILNGTNHYPQDVEGTVEAVGPWVRATCVAAFAVDQADGEGLMVAAELNGRLEGDGSAMIAAIRAAVSLQHEIACAAIVLLPRGSLPKTSSGKIQRAACKAAYLEGGWSPLALWRESEAAVPAAAVAAAPDLAELETRIRELVARSKKIDPRSIGPLDAFADLGISSRLAVEIAAGLEDMLGRPVPATILWEHPHVRALAGFLGGVSAQPASALPTAAVQDIAIIGMACRFPGGCDSPDAFWRLMNGDASAIGAPPADRFPDAAPAWRAGFIDGLFGFDAGFFGITDAEARRMDPQQRLLLATAWHALEDAGLAPPALAGSATGVYVGASASEHAQAGARAGIETRYDATGSSLAIVANRLSYFLDLRGPSLSIDTACSASLVALHQACAALRSGDCDLALAGGVNVLLDGAAMRTLHLAEMLSASGQCRPFDAAADGYVRGEGCGVVVLKPLAAARRDGDRVLAVVRGSAVAQDGRSNGLTAPNGAAQRQVILQALARAGVAPDSVGYVEAHGTGTPLGDPIELRALADCYGGGAATDSTPCAVGAVKAFIGHLEGAAGIAGLIKAVLVLRHGWIPGAPWLHTANPHAGLEGSRLALAKEGRAWEPSPVRRAAVSSFGFGGTLAHAVLEAGDPLPVPETGAADPGPQLLLLSAADPAALGQFVHAYAHMPSQGQAVDWPALCAGAALRRAHLPWRTALVADGGALAAQLAAWREGDAARPSGPDVPAIAFAFTGPDDARPGMGRGLYRRFPAFRTAVDALDEVLHAELGTTAAALLCDAAPSNATARPLCLLLQLGLLRLWQSWGLRPTALWGEGVGAHAASVAAGTLSAADALRLAIADAPLPPGAAAPPALQDGWVLEIGPAPLLRAPGATSALAQGGADDALVAAVLRCAGQLFMAGLPLDWAAVYAGASPARDLPLYPFARTVHRDLPSSVPQRLPATYACEWLDLGPVTKVADMAAGMPPRVVWVADPATGADDPLAGALRRALPASALEVRPWSELPGLCVGADSLVLVQCMARPGEPAAQAALRLGEGLLAGLRALEQSGGRCRVWAVSRQAAALPQDADSSAEAACVQGIGRVAALEMPHLWGGLLDVPPDLAADDVARCLPALWAAGEDQIALRAGRRFAARLRPASLPPGTPPLVLDASLAYWVVGGGGALGRRVLRSLRAAGARHLIVSGRRAAPPDERATEFAGLGVQYLQADIADPRQVERVLAELDRQGLALGGIVHAAGEASEHPIAQLSAERFRAVAEAKVQGAWNLHELTLHRPSLRFFVCFASVSGLWGSGGQAHYAAANHFLDALCEHRRRRGLPALAIDWGPWGGGGLVDAEVERRLRQAGLDPLSPEAAMALFERLLAQGGQGPARIAVADVRWPDFAAGFTARRDSPLLSELLPPPADGPAAGLRGTPEQVAARIRSAVAAAVTAQLGADRVPDADRGLFDQGLDSLAMVAIHQRLTAELGIAFARADMFSYGSVNALADRLLALWQREQGAVPSTEPALQPVAPDAAVPASAMRSGDIVAAIEAEMAALGLSG